MTNKNTAATQPTGYVQTLVDGSTRIQYSTKETAQFIRAALKAAFPSTKFSVRTSYGSCTSSTDISWTDGPTDKEVSAITGQFSSRSFDGQTDSTNYHSQEVNGQRVQYSGWVHTQRRESVALLERAIARFNVERSFYGFGPAALSIRDSGSYAYLEGPGCSTPTGMAGQNYAYDCGTAVHALAASMHANGCRVLEVK